MVDLNLILYSFIGALIIAATAVFGPYVIQYGPSLLSALRRRYLTFEWPDLMSRVADDGDEAEEDENNVFLPAETNSEIAETPQRVAEIQAESFTLGETTALARLVVAGKVGLTDAVKFGAEAKSGEKYQRRSREVKAIVDRLQNKYPHGTPEQERLRRELGLSK